MNDPTPDPDSNAIAMARICKIIAGALIGGVAWFLAIAVFVRFNGGKGLFAADPWDLSPPGAIISLIALAMAAMVAVLAPVVARLMTAALRAKLAAGKPVGTMSPGATQVDQFRMVYQTQMIVRSAMFEGGAFFNGIAFMLEGRAPNLLAALILVVLMVATFPTRGAIDAFVDDQSALMREERQSA